MKDRTEYRSEKGIAAWWQKDGAWHTALPYEPTEADRKQFSASYPDGDNGPFFRWTANEYPTREAAIAAIEHG